MALIALHPKPPQQDANFELYASGLHQAEERRSVPTLPAEWEEQSGVQLTWPHAETDWAPTLADVTEVYVRLAYHICRHERLLIVTPNLESVQSVLEKRIPVQMLKRISYVECPTNDTWARDHAFLTLTDGSAHTLLDYGFNGWGGKFDSALDNAINQRIYESGLLQGFYEDRNSFILEGGSIESNGAGTLLTTEQCLLAPGRNGLTKTQIEQRLLDDFGAERILWLTSGHLDGDDTDGHIDTLARFCPGDAIAYTACDNERDKHYDALSKMEQEIKTLRRSNGAAYKLFRLPLPAPVSDPDDGHRLPATYANFLIINGAVLLPTYRQPQLDRQAASILSEAFPKHEIIGIDAVPLIRQHGSIHCCAMQYPQGVMTGRTAHIETSTSDL